MEDTLNLKQFLNVFRKRFIPIMITSVLTAAAAFLAAKFIIPKSYESSAMLYVENNQNTSDSLNINDITAAQKLVNTCQIIFQSNTMLDTVIFELDLPYTKEELKDMISVSSVNSTEVMRITASNSDPELASDIVNVLVRLAQDEFVRVIKSGSIEVVEYGETAATPSFPNPLIFAAIGFIIGAAISYVISFIVEMLNVTVSSKDDLAKLYSVPVFAEIMDFEGIGSKTAKKENTRKRYVLDESTPFVISEAYRAARTNIIFSLAAGNKNIISFTSAEPGEGKSTTCANMAIAFADMGKHILLVDCDLRKPTVHTTMKLASANGLSSVLGGFCELESAIIKNVRPSLDVITSGPIPPNPTELLGSSNMSKVLSVLSEKYDYIMLDTPPVNIVTDSQLMNSAISGHVIIVKEGSTSHPEIEDALTKIDLAQGKKLGFIKVCCKGGSKSYGGKKHGKYGYYRDYGYSYGYEYKNK